MIDAAVKAPSTRTDEHGSGTACGGAMSREHSKEQEEADMALALVLQAEWEEEERRTQQQRAIEQQQQQRSQAPAAVVGRVLAPSAHPGAAVRPPASGAQAPAARQRAGAAGGVAAEQMALYQLAQQERHAEARLREQQHGMQQQHSPTRTSAPAGAQPAQPYYASQTQPQQAQQQGRGPPGSSPTVSEVCCWRASAIPMRYQSMFIVCLESCSFSTVVLSFSRERGRGRGTERALSLVLSAFFALSFERERARARERARESARERERARARAFSRSSLSLSLALSSLAAFLWRPLSFSLPPLLLLSRSSSPLFSLSFSGALPLPLPPSSILTSEMHISVSSSALALLCFSLACFALSRGKPVPTTR